MSEHVRDGRKGRFWMDDDVLDQYGSELGAYGIAVYAMLCRRANKNGKSHPSLRRLAEDLGISERQAKRELKKLKDLDLISIQPRRDDKGRQLASVYSVLEVPEDCESPRKPGDSETPGGEGSVSHPTYYVGKEDTENKEGVEANASSGKGNLDFNNQDARPQTVGLEKHIVDEIYRTMKEAGKRLPNTEYKFHLGRAKDMLEKDNPTDEELENLPAAFLRTWTIKSRCDAPLALVEMRRQKDRTELLSQPSEAPSYYDQQLSAHDKARSPIWYASVYEADFSVVEGWIKEGCGHEEIEHRLAEGVA